LILKRRDKEYDHYRKLYGCHHKQVDTFYYHTGLDILPSLATEQNYRWQNTNMSTINSEESSEVYSIQHCVIILVSDLWQVDGRYVSTFQSFSHPRLHTHNTKDRITRTPLKKTGDELMCIRRVRSSCCISGTRHVNLVTNAVISLGWETFSRNLHYKPFRRAEHILCQIKEMK
jgi:hypothetical protein